jgi:hypothetical protein
MSEKGTFLLRLNGSCPHNEYETNRMYTVCTSIQTCKRMCQKPGFKKGISWETCFSSPCAYCFLTDYPRWNYNKTLHWLTTNEKILTHLACLTVYHAHHLAWNQKKDVFPALAGIDGGSRILDKKNHCWMSPRSCFLTGAGTWSNMGTSWLYRHCNPGHSRSKTTHYSSSFNINLIPGGHILKDLEDKRE